MTVDSEFLVVHIEFDCIFLSSEMKRIRYTLRLGYSADNLPQGPLDVLVPQAIDEGVKHWGDYGVYH